jgi:phosphoglycolate phosphatase-like HAD superfamily hydrolase
MFDLDGTLFDSMSQLIDTAFNLACNQHPNASEEDLRRQVAEAFGLPGRQLVARVSDLLGWKPADFQTHVNELLAELPSIKTFPEVGQVLASLDAAGFTLVASSTSSESTIWERLQSAGIEGHFRLALGTNAELHISKDDHPRLAAEFLEISPEELALKTAYVGDMPGDMEVAARAGFLAVGRISGDNEEALKRAGADHLIRDLAEVRALVAQA